MMRARRVDCGVPHVTQSAPVLVVDDDASMLRAIGRLLMAHGMRVECFDTGSALCARGNLQEASCLILDVDLGEVSGIELYRKISRRGVSTPVIFITGKDSELTRQEAYAAGCAGYLPKPFASEALVEAIESARNRT
jgi:FixJ family two-component response regulator